MQALGWKLQHERVSKGGTAVLLKHEHTLVLDTSRTHGVKLVSIGILCKRVFVCFSRAQGKHRRSFSHFAHASTLQPRTAVGPMTRSIRVAALASRQHMKLSPHRNMKRFGFDFATVRLFRGVCPVSRVPLPHEDVGRTRHGGATGATAERTRGMEKAVRKGEGRRRAIHVRVRVERKTCGASCRATSEPVGRQQTRRRAP